MAGIFGEFPQPLIPPDLTPSNEPHSWALLVNPLTPQLAPVAHPAALLINPLALTSAPLAPAPSWNFPCPGTLLKQPHTTTETQ